MYLNIFLPSTFRREKFITNELIIQNEDFTEIMDDEEEHVTDLDTKM